MQRSHTWSTHWLSRVFVLMSLFIDLTNPCSLQHKITLAHAAEDHRSGICRVANRKAPLDRATSLLLLQTAAALVPAECCTCKARQQLAPCQLPQVTDSSTEYFTTGWHIITGAGCTSGQPVLQSHGCHRDPILGARHVKKKQSATHRYFATKCWHVSATKMRQLSSGALKQTSICSERATPTCNTLLPAHTECTSSRLSADVAGKRCLDGCHVMQRLRWRQIEVPLL